MYCQIHTHLCIKHEVQTRIYIHTLQKGNLPKESHKYYKNPKSYSITLIMKMYPKWIAWVFLQILYSRINGFFYSVFGGFLLG